MTTIDRTYCGIIKYIENLSARINKMYGITPPVCVRFNQTNNIGGAAIAMYKIPDMYIVVHLPYNYMLRCPKDHTILAITLIHEYCHYIAALHMNASERIVSVEKYHKDHSEKRADEQRNWTATKKLAKELGLWNKRFYNAIKGYSFSTLLKY